MHVLISFKSLYKNGLDFKMGNYVKLFACASHLKKTWYTVDSLSRLRLSRIAAYLEVTISSLF